MPKQLIHGVTVKKLQIHCDERGRLMEMIRSDDKDNKQTDHFVCVRGMMKVVLFDAREGSPTKGQVNEFFIGEHSPLLIEIPNLVYHGFKCISDHEAMVINFTTETYDYQNPDEFRLDPH